VVIIIITDLYSAFMSEDTKALCHFSHHCGIGDFRRFLTQSLANFYDTVQNDSCPKENESNTFWDLGDVEIQIQINPDSNLGSDFSCGGVCTG